MSAATVAAALGGRRTLRTDVRSDFDLDAAVKAGISAAAVAAVLNEGLLTVDEIYTLVIPRRTLERRRDGSEPLTVDESDKLLRVVRVIVRAVDAIGDVEKARRWLRTPNRALRGALPIEMLATDIGARLVEQTLGRIEHGVAS